MCGIFCIFRAAPTNLGEPLLSPEALDRVLARLKRRGPDGTGTYTTPDRRCLMVHTRLAIQDTSDAGHQPMFDAPPKMREIIDPGVVVCFNGEIYNAPALRLELEQLGVKFHTRTDTEVIVHGFKKWGFEGEAGLLNRLRGMFAIVILDRRAPDEPVVYGAVDHVGMKPLIFSVSSQIPGKIRSPMICTITSDMDALRASWNADDRRVMHPEKSICTSSLVQLLTGGYQAPFNCFWSSGIRLDPGEGIIWRPRSERLVKRFRWYRPPTVLRPAHEATQEQFEAIFEQVVDEHLISDRPVGLFLSAGLDSSAIALALARRGRAKEIGACTLATRNADPATDEAPDAAALAGRLGMAHRTIAFAPQEIAEAMSLAAEAYDAPQGFTALLTAARIARETKAAADAPAVVLAGDGGDEAFGGYSWHRATPHPLALHGENLPPHEIRSYPLDARFTELSPLVREPGCDPQTRLEAARRINDLTWGHRYLRRIYPGLHPMEALALIPSFDTRLFEESSMASWLHGRDCPTLPHPRRAQRMDAQAFLPGSILTKIDQSSMHVALEMRAPFLDRRVLEFGLTAPVEPEEATPQGAKPFLRRYLQRGVADGLIPERVLHRPKQGFSLRTTEDRPFTRMAAEWLPGTQLLQRGVIRPDFAVFQSPDAEAREVQSFTLCFLAAWFEKRV